LQERWPLFLSRLSSTNQIREDSPEYGLKYPGPDRLPFDHQNIKVYIDNLFLEGKLTCCWRDSTPKPSARSCMSSSRTEKAMALKFREATRPDLLSSIT